MANAWDNVIAAGAVDDEWGRFYAQQAMRMSTTDGSAPRFDYVQQAAPAPAPVAAPAPSAGNVNPGGSATYNEMQQPAQPGALGQGVQNYFKPETGGSGWSLSDNVAYTDPNTGKTYTKTGGDGTGTPLQIIEFDPRTQKPGDTLNVYNPDGSFSHTFQSSQDEGTRLAMMALAAAGGMMMLPGGLLSSTYGAGTMAAQAGLEGGGAAAAGGGAAGGGLNVSQGFTDGGTAGGALDTAYATGSAGTPYTTLTSGGVLPNGTGGAVGSVAAGAAGGLPPGAVTSTPMELVPVPPAANLSTVAPLAGATGAGTLGTVASLAGPAASVVGGVVASNAARDAADTQAAAGREANALTRELYYDQVNRAEPFRIAGVQSVNSLADRLGVSGRTGATGYGELTKKFGMADYQADPGYSFRMAEGQKALDRRLAAGGNLYSGKAIKDTIAYGQGMGAQEFGAAFDRWNTQNTNTYNRLAGVAGAGQTANAQLGSAAQAYGNNASATIQGIGNAQAAGRVGSANALMNGITQGVSSYMNNNILDRVLSGRGY